MAARVSLQIPVAKVVLRCLPLLFVMSCGGCCDGLPFMTLLAVAFDLVKHVQSKKKVSQRVGHCSEL